MILNTPITILTVMNEGLIPVLPTIPAIAKDNGSAAAELSIVSDIVLPAKASSQRACVEENTVRFIPPAPTPNTKTIGRTVVMV
jgi:hypothetical protein